MANEKEIEVVFKALANPRRIAMLRFLSTVKTKSVGDIAFKMKLSIHATSKHLTQLYRAGLLEREQKSLIVYYSLNKKNQVLKIVLSLLSNQGKLATMESEKRNCQKCKQDFTIEPDDFSFYDKIDVASDSLPTMSTHSPIVMEK